MQHMHQKVFADFLQKIDNKDGWWYQVPRVHPSSGERPIIPQDCIMPHFGMVFGLSEDAAAIVLESMGLLSLNVSKGETKVFKDRWDDFCGLHQIANTSMEVQKAKFAWRYWYVQLGKMLREFPHPCRIWQIFCQDHTTISLPTTITSQKTIGNTMEKFMNMVKESSLFDWLQICMFESSPQTSAAAKQRSHDNFEDE
ncbi:hypothetical protein ACA910_006041 [Epithemia clementina (nom. ined.)]